MKFINRKAKTLLTVLSATLLLSACDNDNDASLAPPPPAQEPSMARFNVLVENLTNSQPLSPIAVIAHQDGFSYFAVGSPASEGLEILAEGGDNTMFLDDANADAMVMTTGSGAAAIGPSGSEFIIVEVPESDLPGLQISVATMLVNTNDAFSGLNAIPVDGLVVGELMVRRTIAYDAGTEADTETAATIPGPAGGGEGFNAVRDDQADQVSMHSGVVSQDDGLASSDLTEQHRFDNPVASIRIVRTD